MTQNEHWQPIFVDSEGVHISMDYYSFGTLNREALEDTGTAIADMDPETATMTLCYLAVRRHCNLMDEVLDTDTGIVIANRENDGDDVVFDLLSERIMRSIEDSLRTTRKLHVRLFDLATTGAFEGEPLESFIVEQKT